MAKKLFINPIFETKIDSAVFIHQDLVVHSDRDKRLPDNIGEVIKFLFGEGAHIIMDETNGYPTNLTIVGACYELRNVRTLNAVWTYREVEQ